MGLIKGKLFNKGNQFLPQAQLVGIDTNNILGTNVSVSPSDNATLGTIYTAIEDCFVLGTFSSNGYVGYWLKILVNGVDIVPSQIAFTLDVPYSFVLKKGDTLQTNSNKSRAKYIIYGLKH